MVNPWRKYKNAPKRKKQALHSLVAGLAFFTVLFIVTSIFKITLCPIHRFWGISCFGCGLTRGFIAILRLDIGGAIRYHILSIPLFVGIVLYAIFCITDILLGRDDLARLSGVFGRKNMLFFYLFLLLFSTIVNYYIRL